MSLNIKNVLAAGFVVFGGTACGPDDAAILAQECAGMQEKLPQVRAFFIETNRAPFEIVYIPKNTKERFIEQAVAFKAGSAESFGVVYLSDQDDVSSWANFPGAIYPGGSTTYPGPSWEVFERKNYIGYSRKYVLDSGLLSPSRVGDWRRYGQQCDHVHF